MENVFLAPSTNQKNVKKGYVRVIKPDDSTMTIERNQVPEHLIGKMEAKLWDELDQDVDKYDGVEDVHAPEAVQLGGQWFSKAVIGRNTFKKAAYLPLGVATEREWTPLQLDELKFDRETFFITAMNRKSFFSVTDADHKRRLARLRDRIPFYAGTVTINEKGLDVATSCVRDWLNDEILNGCLQSFNCPQEGTLFLSTFFFTKHAKVSLSIKKIIKWINNALNGVEGSGMKRLIVPFNQGKSHWVLYVVTRTGDVTVFGGHLRHRENEKLLKFVANHLWGIDVFKNPPKFLETKQSDGFSCGVHACWYAWAASFGAVEKLSFEYYQAHDYVRRMGEGKRWMLKRIEAIADD